jgi:hypothetical protein
LAESFASVRRHAGEERDDVARLVLQEATRRLRTVRQSQRRYEARTVPLSPRHAKPPTVDLFAARTQAEWLAKALLDAVRQGGLGASDARLVYAARVKGLPASEVGRREGMAAKAVYYALARAERAFMAAAA